MTKKQSIPTCQKCRKETKELFEIPDEYGCQLQCAECAPLKFVRRNKEKLEVNVIKKSGGFF